MLAAAALLLGVAACDGSNLFTAPSTGNSDIPTVVAVTVPDVVRPSDILEIEVVAISEAGVTSVDVTVLEDVVRERTLTIDPPETDVSVFTEFQLPATLAQEVIVVRVEVEDQSGARSEPFEVEIPVLPDEGPF